ncbi:MAG: aldehyde dehydrogenase family protein [Planctomycetota bacterium]|jgi:acyl-CoA reductase-like NAD-dependent aldehyde dehydrogenase
MSIDVKKTYKLYCGGKFPRSESGRVYQPAGAAEPVNVSQASRKDLRDAVRAARSALPAWSARTAYNRGQILYRIAEMLQTRKAAMVDEITACTQKTRAAAGKEVAAAVDLATFHAGMPDKLQQLLGAQNEVSGPFFNFSTVEPTGVIGAVAPAAPSLVGCMGMLLPILAGANTVVLIVSEAAPLPGLVLGEVLATSDVPDGVINLLAGDHQDLARNLASHRDVDGLLVAGKPDKELGTLAADSVKRVRFLDLSEKDWMQADKTCSLFLVEPFVEVKTLWHPVSS